MPKNSSQQLFVFFANAGYFIVVFLIALALSTLALTRKLNSLDTSRNIFLLKVTKEELPVSNTVAGKVKKIFVQTGQNVKKGDLLVELEDEVSAAKITTLQKVADENLSAKTEISVLKAQRSQYQLYAPKDGVVYKIDTSEGTFLQANTVALTLFTNSNTKLYGEVSPAQYMVLQKQPRLNVYSPRLEQVYGVELEGVSRVLPLIQSEGPRYELAFHFTKSEDALNFIQAEDVDVISRTRADDEFKPSTFVAKFWNSFIIGK